MATLAILLGAWLLPPIWTYSPALCLAALFSIYTLAGDK
jgi:hypothetical protein